MIAFRSRRLNRPTAKGEQPALVFDHVAKKQAIGLEAREVPTLRSAAM